MSAPVFSAELAQERAGDLRRAAERARVACGPDGCEGFFSTFVTRVRSDLQRLQLGPTGAAPCPC